MNRPIVLMIIVLLCSYFLYNQVIAAEWSEATSESVYKNRYHTPRPTNRPSGRWTPIPPQLRSNKSWQPRPTDIAKPPSSGAGMHVVGNGSLASCTEAAFAEAIAQGGTITFNCGQPATIFVTQQHLLTKDTVIDGGGSIILDGQKRTSILHSKNRLNITLKNITLNNGHTKDQGGAFDVGYWNNLTVLNSSFNNNVASADAKACDGGGAFFIGGGSVVYFENVHFAQNEANNGGAINNLRSALTIINGSFEKNRATHTDRINQKGDCGGGGAVYFDGTRKPEDGGADKLIIRNVSFTENTTNNHGGAIFLGIRSNENVEISNTTFYGNKTVIASSLAGSGTGGAVWIGQGAGGQRGYQINIFNTSFINNQAEGQGGGLWTSSPATLTNVTFVGNSVINPRISDRMNWRRGNGGAISAADRADVKIYHATIVRNTAGFNGGGLNGEKISVWNSLISENSGGWAMGLQQNCTHEIVSGSGNLQFLANMPDLDHAHESNCGKTVPVANPTVGQLGNYGGNMLTLPLLAGSPAIDQAHRGSCTTKDQRGIPRPQGAGCDMGAFEYQP